MGAATDKRASGLTHHDVLHDRLQHHLFKDVFHQDKLRKVFKDQLLEARQFLGVTKRKEISSACFKTFTECTIFRIFLVERVTCSDYYYCHLLDKVFYYMSCLY